VGWHGTVQRLGATPVRFQGSPLGFSYKPLDVFTSMREVGNKLGPLYCLAEEAEGG